MLFLDPARTSSVSYGGLIIDLPAKTDLLQYAEITKWKHSEFTRLVSLYVWSKGGKLTQWHKGNELKKNPNQMQIWDTNMSLSQKYENNRNWYGKTWTATILNKLSRKKSQVRTKTQTHTQELSAQCRLRGRFEDARERGITTNVAFTKIPGEFFFLASDFSTQISDLNCHIRKMVKKKKKFNTSLLITLLPVLCVQMLMSKIHIRDVYLKSLFILI